MPSNRACLRGRNTRRYAVVVGIVATTLSAPALAYLDPGTGSILLQGLLATLAAVAAAGSIFWNRVKTAFSSMRPGKKSPPSDSDQDPDQ